MKNYVQSVYMYFQFDRKTMGFLFFVPLLMFVLSLFMILFIDRGETGLYNHIIVIQGVFIPFSCWCLMYRLSEMYEEGAQETLAPYYSKRFILDFIRYFMTNLIGVFLLVSVFVLSYGANELQTLNIVHFILLVLFYMFFGTTLMVLLKNIEMSLTIILIYTVLEVVTLGTFMPWPHIFLFERPIWEPFLMTKFILLMMTVFVLMVVTFVYIKRTDRKPQ